MKKILKVFALISICLFAVILLMSNQSFATDAETVTVSTEVDLRDALESGQNVILGKDIVIEELSKSTIDDSYGRNRAGIVVSNSVNINGNGKKISTADIGTIFEIYAEEGNVEVTFQNVEIENTKAGGRCIDTRTGNIELNIVSSSLKTTKMIDGINRDQALTIGGDYKDAITVNINKSNILSEEGYGIITFNPVNLNIDNTTVDGFAALNMKGKSSSQGSENSIVNIKNCSKIIGENNYSEGDNNFGVIALEDDGITINIKNSVIEALGEGTKIQSIFNEKGTDLTKKNIITIADNSTIELQERLANIVNENTVIKIEEAISNVDFNLDVKINEEENEDRKKYLAEEVVCKKVEEKQYRIGREYNIIVKDVEGGKVTVDKTKAQYGETVNLTTKVDEGYVLKLIEVSSGTAGGRVGDWFNVSDRADMVVTPVFEKLKQTIEASDEVVIDEKTESMLLGSLEDVLKENRELANLVNNNNVEIEVILEDAKVEDKEKETIEKAIEEKVKNIKVAKYLDISVNVKVILDEIPGGKVVEQLEQLKEKLTFSVEIPTDLTKVEDGYTRTYYIIRNHNGAVEILDTKVSEDGKVLNFSSDKFSTYAIAYTDEKINEKIEDKVEDKIEEKDITPKTGSLDITLYVSIILVISSFIGIVTKKKVSKHSK